MAFSQFLPCIWTSGALIPVQYNEEFCDTNFNVISLQRLCASKLISDSSLLDKKVSIASTMKKLLMNVAIQEERILSIRTLLDSWPYDTIQLTLPDVFKTWKRFAKPCNDSISGLTKAITVILNHFIHPNGTLKYLNFSEIPLQNEQVDFVCNIVMKEKTQKSTSVKYVIFVNCVVSNRLTLHKLRSAVLARKREMTKIKLVIKALHIAPDAVYDQSLLELLELLDAHELEHFSFNFFPDCIHKSETLSCLKVFHSLKVLNLACNHSVANYKQLLDEAVQLEALDVGKCVVGGQLEMLLKDMYKKSHHCCQHAPKNELKFLGLQDCKLYNSSVLYLAKSAHAPTLLNLDLSGNTFELTSLILLLHACINLHVLQLADCGFSTNELKPLFEAFSLMRKLKYLNIAFNLDSIATGVHLVTYAPLLAQMPSLVCLRIPKNFSGLPITSADTMHSAIIQYSNLPSREIEVLS